LKLLAVLLEVFVFSAAIIFGFQKIQSCKNVVGDDMFLGDQQPVELVAARASLRIFIQVSFNLVVGLLSLAEDADSIISFASGARVAAVTLGLLETTSITGLADAFPYAVV
ncbi:hypothetical protein KCU81_g498, partial [Aureobasidium melanogenum]